LQSKDFLEAQKLTHFPFSVSHLVIPKDIATKTCPESGWQIYCSAKLHTNRSHCHWDIGPTHTHLKT